MDHTRVLLQSPRKKRKGDRQPLVNDYTIKDQRTHELTQSVNEIQCALINEIHLLDDCKLENKLKRSRHDSSTEEMVTSRMTKVIPKRQLLNPSWELRFLISQISRHLHQKQKSGITMPTKIELNDPFIFLPSNLQFPKTSKFSLIRGRDTKSEPPNINILQYTLLYTVDSKVIIDYTSRGNPVAVLGELALLRQLNPQCTITLHDPCNPDTTERCWALFNTDHLHTDVLGITPIHFVTNVTFEKDRDRKPYKPQKRDPVYIRLLSEFIASEENRLNNKRLILSDGTPLKKSNETNDEKVNQSIQCESVQLTEQKRAFRNLTPYYHNISKYHPSRCRDNVECPTIDCPECELFASKHYKKGEYPLCVELGFDILTKVFKKGREYHSIGRAADYATKLAPFLKREDIEVLVIEFFNELQTRSKETSITSRKIINKLLHFIESYLERDSEHLGKIVLQMLSEHSITVTTSHPNVWRRLSEWTTKTVNISDTDIWQLIAVKIGIQPLPKIDYLGTGSGSSSFESNVATETKVTQFDPTSVGGWNVNSVKKRWAVSPNAWQPKPVSEYTLMNRGDKRKLSFQDVVHCGGTPDVLFVFESKATLQTILKLPGMFSWRQSTGYDHVYSTWTTQHKNSAGHAGTCVFSKIKPEEIIYGFNTPHVNWEGEGRVISLVFKNFDTAFKKSPPI